MSPTIKMLIGIVVTVASAWAFHGPGGYGARALAKLDAQIRPVVEAQELPGVTAAFLTDPMSRDLRFSGQANSFQRTRFVELIQEEDVRGLRTIGWDPDSLAIEDLPAIDNSAAGGTAR